MEFYAQIPKSQPPYTVIVHEENLAWQIKNVLSKEECDFFKQFALEVCGYKTPVENNPAQATFTSEALAQDIFNRIKNYLPALSQTLMLCPEQYYNYKLVGLNANWRFYKYTVGRFLPIHVDKSYEQDVKSLADGLIHKQKTFLSINFYLTSNSNGAATNIYGHSILQPPRFSIQPSAGDAIIFVHNVRHEGAPLLETNDPSEAEKILLRSDAYYEL